MSVYTSLAVKYRPLHWEDVAGQKAAVTRLKGIIKTGKVPQALLFTGPSGTGKTTLARMFARYLNCAKQTACGKCEHCKAGDMSPDIRELNGAEARGIDDVRALISEARFKPSLGKYRFIILDEAQQLTAQAAQSLLKPLEEPPQHTIYIICSMEPEKLHQAMVPRCSAIQLEAPSRDDVANRLAHIANEEGYKLFNAKVAAPIAEASGGQVRNAVSLLEAVIQYLEGNDKKLTKENYKEVVDAAIKQTVNLADDMVAMKVLLSLYKGKLSSLHSALLDATDFNALINKMTYLNMYMLDALLAKDHNKVWHNAPSNRKMLELCKSNLKNFGDSYANVFLKVQDAINQIKLELGTFLATDRAIFAAKLGLLATSLKAS